MFKAVNNHSTSLCSPAAVLGTVSQDAELLALCAECVALDREFIRLGAEEERLSPNSVEAKACDRRMKAMVPRIHELEDLIADIVPRTREGLLAKAEAAYRSLVSDADAEEGGHLLSPDSYLACMVIENLLGRTP